MGAILKAINTKSSSRGSSGSLKKYLDKEDSLKTGIDCNPEKWDRDFSLTKSIHSKTEGRQYKHFAQSFEKGCKLTPEEIHQSGLDLIKSCKQFENFQAIVITHMDKEHLHNHIVINSVNSLNGKKLQLSNSNLKTLKKNMVINLEKKYNLNPIKAMKHVRKNQRTNTHQVLEKALQGEYESYLVKLSKDIQEDISNSANFQEFTQNLSKKGIKVDISDKHNTLMFETPEGKKISSKRLSISMNQDFSKLQLEKEFKLNQELKEISKIDYTKIKIESIKERELKEELIQKEENERMVKWLRKVKERSRGGIEIGD